MKKIAILWVLLCFVFRATVVLAQDGTGYQINSFKSEINLNQNTGLTIKETIDTYFYIQKHGIFRVIPYIYSANGKTIRTSLVVKSVTNENGVAIPFTVENYNQSKRLQIGDANKLITGKQVYVITYMVNKVIQDYGEGPELYWNVTGSEWDVPVPKAVAEVTSDFADITKIECYGCVSKNDKNTATFSGSEGLTIVVGFDKNNQLILPGTLEKLGGVIVDNWGYGVAILPCLIMLLAWFFKGRDKKYDSENVFYKPDDGTTQKNTPLLSRPHLPLVYSPIDGLSPSEVGTIIDERVDTKDVVAEIVELARLGYFTIEKIETKKLFGVDRDYKLTKIEKTSDGLKEFQKYLWESLFESGNNEVKISELKDHFYIHLKTLRSKIYQEMTEEKMFDGNPVTTKIKWLVITILLNTSMYVFLMVFFVTATGNGGPIVIMVLGIILTLILANAMPRKTAWGYSLSRQAVGLKYYLGKGKWREEISEKRLFLEEMLPLAIALGVVDKLAADMRELEIEPPQYFQGVVLTSFVSDMSNFNTVAATGLVSAPSGNSSWGGGSGFSGGGGGGGFGGGGGGSW